MSIKKNDKQRLFEVMSRLDKTFKPKLTEEFTGGGREEYLAQQDANLESELQHNKTIPV